MGITAYHRFEFALLTKQLTSLENVLLEITWPSEERKPSKYDTFFAKRITLPIEKHFFRKPSTRKIIDKQLEAIAQSYRVTEILVAQDLDARMQYCATYFGCAPAVVEDGMISYVQTVDRWRVLKRLLTYKLFLGSRYPNCWGMGFLPAARYFAFDTATAFPKIADREKIKAIEISTRSGLQDWTGLDRCLIVITQPLVEDDLATEESEAEVFEALGRAAAALQLKLLIRSHPRELPEMIERRIRAMQRGGARVDLTVLKDYEVIEEAFAAASNPPVFGFSSTALSNAQRINPKLKVLSAVRWLSRVPARERQVYVNALSKAGVTILEHLGGLEAALRSMHEQHR